MQINKLDLLSRGWSVHEVEHASNIIDKAESTKHYGIKLLDRTSYWLLLILLIIGNAICAIFLIPFLFTVKNYFIILIVGLTGFIFGVIFSILVVDIQNIEQKANYSIASMVFLSGLLNYGILTYVSIEAANRYNIELTNNPYVLGIVYLIAFLTPHIVFLIKSRKTE